MPGRMQGRGAGATRILPVGYMDITVGQVIETLGSFKFTYDNEIELQDGIAAAFTGCEILFEREARLGDDLKIDFMIPGGIGVEVKIKGSPSDVARQLLAYANRPEITCLILVTARAALSRLPPILLGKKLYVVPLWRSFL
jgi:hypothetical protein